MSRTRNALACAIVAVALMGCGESTREEIVKKAEGADTTALLEKALGKPDEVSAEGAQKVWVYHAADGTVSFTIAGDHVTASAVADKKRD